MRITALLGTAALIAAAPAFADDHGNHSMMKTETVTQTKTMGYNGADFAMYDSDKDGRVSFGEYYKMAKKDGVSSTLAAQRFNKMTSGTYYLDAPTFETAMRFDGTYYDTLPYQSTTTLSTNTAVLGTTNTSVSTETSTLSNDGMVESYDYDRTETTTMPLGTMTESTDYNYDSGMSGASSTMTTTTTTQSAIDPLNPANPADVYDEFKPTGEYMDGMPKATVEPGYRFEDQVGGDLTQTDNPMMQVRPKTIGTETETDIDIDID